MGFITTHTLPAGVFEGLTRLTHLSALGPHGHRTPLPGFATLNLARLPKLRKLALLNTGGSRCGLHTWERELGGRPRPQLCTCPHSCRHRAGGGWGGGGVVVVVVVCVCGGVGCVWGGSPPL